MHVRTLAAIMAATMSIAILPPGITAIPSSACTAPDRDPQDGTGACATIAGPLSMDVKNIFFTGVGFCIDYDDDTGIPELDGFIGDCTNSPGSVGGIGALPVNNSGCNAFIGCIYDIWAIQIGGLPITGWGVAACTDRNDLADTCTNVGEDVDDFGFGYKGEELAGESKETKDEDWAHTDFCARPDVDDLEGDGVYDNIWVFITIWTDENLIFGSNTGSGIGLGLFDIQVDFNREAASVSDCFSALDSSPLVSAAWDP